MRAGFEQGESDFESRSEVPSQARSRLLSTVPTKDEKQYPFFFSLPVPLRKIVPERHLGPIEGDPSRLLRNEQK
jgi:hypothetical protein